MEDALAQREEASDEEVSLLQNIGAGDLSNGVLAEASKVPEPGALALPSIPIYQ